MEYIKQFVNDRANHWTNNIVQQGEYIYASDCYIIARTIGVFENGNNTKEELETYFYKKQALGSINIENIKDLLEKIKVEPLYFNTFKSCDECEGTGRVECDYGHYHDCNECDGEGKTGKADKSKLIGYTFKENDLIKIYGKAFEPERLEKVVNGISGNFDTYITAKNTLMLQNEKYEIIIMNSFIDETKNLISYDKSNS